MGILQFQGNDEETASIRFRYKLVEVPPIEVPPFEFSTRFQLESEKSAIVPVSWFDLETGQALDIEEDPEFTKPENHEEYDDDDIRRWKVKHGIDFIANPTGERPGLIGIDTGLSHLALPAQFWGRLPKGIEEWIGAPYPMTGIPLEDRSIHLFRSREGQLGLLQLEGAVDKPAGIRIRYRWITSRDVGAEPPANSSSLLPTIAEGNPAESHVLLKLFDATVREDADALKELFVPGLTKEFEEMGWDNVLRRYQTGWEEEGLFLKDETLSLRLEFHPRGEANGEIEIIQNRESLGTMRIRKIHGQWLLNER